MKAHEVLAGLKATEWRRVYGGAMTQRRCPVCHGYAPGDAIEDECGHDECCAIATAIAYLETVVRDEDLQVARDAAYSLRARVESYDGGDRPMSPPVALIRELCAAEDRLRELRAKRYFPRQGECDECVKWRHADESAIGSCRHRMAADGGR